MQRLNSDSFQVHSVRVYYDPKTTTRVTELPNLMKYESQHFRCKVQMSVDEGVADRCWSVGLVQACDRMYLENRYGQFGSSFWEFHPLKSGRHKMVNDSDGRQYPFYSLTSSKFEIQRGSLNNSFITLSYEDHFYPTVAWELPYYGGTHLTDVIRKQDFWVWLVAIKRNNTRFSSMLDAVNPKKDEVHILKTIRWRFNLHMSFDPMQPVTKRLKQVFDIQDEKPTVLSYNRSIPISALSPPHCNSAQSLIWYPKIEKDRPKLLVPPKQIIVPWDTWTEDMAPGKSFSVRRPDPCKMVGEWPNDLELGFQTTSSPMKYRLPASVVPPISYQRGRD